MHEFIGMIDGLNIPFEYYDNIHAIPHAKIEQPDTFYNLTNGNIAIAKHVFEKIKWSNTPRGQDLEFNRHAYDVCKNNIVIKIPLIAYFYRRTSWLPEKVEKYNVELFIL